MAYRSILRRSIFWIIAVVLLSIIFTLLDQLRPATGEMVESLYYFVTTGIYIFVLLLLACKLLYEVIYYHVYYYGTELEHFVISKGIFYKTRGSFPLARMTDVYLERNPIDLIFMLYNIRVTTPSPIIEYGAIDGLSWKRASELQNYLLALVNTTVPQSDEQLASEAVRSGKATEDPSILGPNPADSDPPRAKAQVLPDEEKAKADAKKPPTNKSNMDVKEVNL